MRDTAKERLEEMSILLKNTTRKLLEDIEKEIGYELTGENTQMMIDTYKASIKLVEDYYDSKIKYEYLRRPNVILSEEDIECIEANKGKHVKEILTALKSVTKNEDVSNLLSLIIDGNTYDSKDSQKVTDILMDICIFIRLYNKGREEEISSEFTELSKVLITDTDS